MPAAELALAMVTVANAVREGIILSGQFIDFAQRSEEPTAEEADALIDKVTLEILENIRNNDD